MSHKITAGERLALLKHESNEYLAKVCYACGYFKELQALRIEPAKWYRCVMSSTIYLEISKMVEESLCIQVHLSTPLSEFAKKFMELGNDYVLCNGMKLNIKSEYLPVVESMLRYYVITKFKHGEYPLKSEILTAITQTRRYYDYLNALSTIEIRNMNPMDLCKSF